MKNYLENEVNKLLNYINSNNYGLGFKLHPNRNYDGIYIQGELFDYILFTKKQIYAFDAKQTISNKWRLQKKDKKQLSNLLKIKPFNVKSFFLIYFITQNKLMKIEAEKVLFLIPDRKYITESDCKIFDWKELINE